MNRAWTMILAIVIALHGLVHLMGTFAYLKLAEVQGLPYKTTMFGGQWDMGEVGITIFGLLWAVAAVGFVSSAIGLIFKRFWWRPVLFTITSLSLALTVLDSSVAFAGLFINLLIVVFLIADSRFGKSQFSHRRMVAK
jgi:hypothetical protein